MIEMKAIGGRYPLDSLARFRRQNIRATLEHQDGALILRIDDICHIEAWQEYVIEVQALLNELQVPRE